MMKSLFKCMNGAPKIGARVEGNGPLFLDEPHRVCGAYLLVGDEHHGDARGGALHSRHTVHQNMATFFVFRHDFKGDFGGPQLQIADFFLLQIVVHGDAVFNRNQWGKREVLCAIKNDRDVLSLNKCFVDGCPCISQP